jgi:hypothetical protein
VSDDYAGTELAAAGRLAAGRWDRDPMRPNPGPGMWIDPGPVAGPETAAPADADPGKAEAARRVAMLARNNGERRRGPASPDERTRGWSTDARTPTVRNATRGVR